jgi:hypothetical protein
LTALSPSPPPAPQPQQGLLCLADITGFSSFLAGSELTHAQDILQEVLELAVARLTPPLNLVEVEGDAVYAYALDGRFHRGETFLDTLETTYFAFRDRQADIVRRTTCQCNACRSIPALDLKFVAHCGEFLLQTIAGRAKPIGPAVNLVHRLLKNGVGEATGWRAYVLLSADCTARLGIAAEEFHRQVETYDVGAVETFSHDLHPRYEAMRERRRLQLRPEDGDHVEVYDLAAPPAVAWEWINDPRLRTKWEGQMVWLEGLRAGRTAVGSVSHCAHGKKETSRQTILDWRPFDYFTQSVADSKGNPMGTNTVRFETIPGGTRVTDILRFEGKPKPIAKIFYRLVFLSAARKAIQNLQRMVAKEASAES